MSAIEIGCGLGRDVEARDRAGTFLASLCGIIAGATVGQTSHRLTAVSTSLNESQRVETPPMPMA